jgi:tetratricopeptide (TPR) repeat protein
VPLVSAVTRHVVPLVLVWASVWPASAQVGRPEGLYYKSWAVIVAVDDYLVAPKLTGSVASGKALAAALKQLGFEEILELYDRDAGFRRLQHLLTHELLQKVGRQDRVVFFFAGHTGVTTDRNGHDLGYLVPWDAHVGTPVKAISLDQLKEFAHRAMAKHIVFLLDAGVRGWETTPPQQLSLEGRVSPELETDKRAAQVLTAADKGERPERGEGTSLFVEILLSGLQGAADENQNGWLMGSELAAYVRRVIETRTGSWQHPQFAQIDGDGDVIFIEGRKHRFMAKEPKTEAERLARAKELYDEAFSLLQKQRPPAEALELLDHALAYHPTFGDAYVLKSYVYLDLIPRLDEALAAANLAMKHAPDNPDSHFTLGLIWQRKGRFPEAEHAFQQALAVNPRYSDVYLALGDLYVDGLKNAAKAVEAYRHYVETGGTDPRAKSMIEKLDAVPRTSDTP